MENRKLVVIALGLCLSLAQAKAEESNAQIRFYKANKQLQTSRIFFAGKRGRKTGCQNLVKKKRIFQVNQFGFAYCTLYKKKNCAADSLVQVTRKKDDTPTDTLTQGYSWFLISEHPRGIKMRSWHCHTEASENTQTD